ncbi:M35 family metallopeptidase [Pseudomonas aegrilactucae]|uniref:M35 family metallopeptidase n=1 Tax=Pseudomonas aegrilactucae TaxID=2854028 RepID=A0A9Q2XM86_9PSED|nr:M35 family metallopeptidase [Pseudomonas aegrilactucae]MBV6288701.1 M35 family metallopeptidase [Pseudomonas aegrilactucae]
MRVQVACSQNTAAPRLGSKRRQQYVPPSAARRYLLWRDREPDKPEHSAAGNAMITAPYFETGTLRADFITALQTALRELSLSIIEAGWLHRLADEATPPASMLVEVWSTPQPLSVSCLVIRQSDPQLEATYLYSPLHGVQGFNTLSQLQSALQAQLKCLGVPSEPLQFECLSDSVFSQWSQRLIQQQVDWLRRQSRSLAELPTLASILDSCLSTSFSTLLEGVAQSAQQRVQVIASDDSVVRTEALADVALNAFSGQALGDGLKYRFLRDGAVTHDTPDHLAFEQALVSTASLVSGAFAQTLRAYWDSADNEGGTDNRQALALGLADNYCRALLRAANSRLIDAAQLQWLREALIPSVVALRVSTLTFVPATQDEGETVLLADSLALHQPDDSDKGVFLFDTRAGFQHFTDQAALQRHCQALLTQASCPASISPDHWDQLQNGATPDLKLAEVSQPAFLVLADALIALINRRLAHALRFPGAQSSTARARVEDALDMRALVDRRLTHLGVSGRWRPTQRQERPVSLPAPPSQSLTLVERLTRARALYQLFQHLAGAQPDVQGCVQDMLAPSLAALSDGQLQAQDIQLTWARKTASLTDVFLEQLKDIGTQSVLQGVQVQDRQGMPLTWPSAQLIQQQLDNLKMDFSPAYLDQLKAFDTGHVRLQDGVVSPFKTLRALHEALLRIELAQARENTAIDNDLLDLLQQALDRPGHSPMRLYSLSLSVPGKSGLLALACTFVLQRATADDGSLLLWSPLEPLSQFSNQAALRSQMGSAFDEPEKLQQWLGLVNCEDLSHWHTPAQWPGASQPDVRLIEQSDLFGFLAHSAASFRSSTRRYYLSYSLRSRFTSSLLQRVIDNQAARHPFEGALKRVRDSIECQYFQSLLPSWLRHATPLQMKNYAQLVQASARVSNPKFNYLFSIPTLNSFADQQLRAGLAQDYPSAPGDPNLIIVTFTHFTPNLVLPGQTPSPMSSDVFTTSKTLTEYALTHSQLTGTATSVKVSAMRPGLPAQELNAETIRNMVDRLDVASAFRALLQKKLSPQDPDYLTRHHRYTQTSTAYLMEEAYQHFLEKKLSATALYYFSHVLAKPDALAREPVEGRKITIAQLQLRAAEGFVPDTVRGMYVIGPQGEQDGPLVLYSAYRPENILLEFTDQAALRNTILADAHLQKDILARLPEAVQSRYDHKGFVHPHLFWSSSDVFDFATTPGAVELVRSEIEGNALDYLFTENVAFLLALTKARTVTTAEEYWNVLRYVMGLAIEQSSFFLPGKLAATLNSLQSVQWLQASGKAALQHNWGESLAEFVTALSGLATARPSGSSVSRKAQHQTPPVTPPLELDPVWDEVLLTPLIPNQLSDLQAQNVQLKDMVENTTLGLYLAPATERFYGVIAGHVYEVVKPGQQWQIIKEGRLGPKLQRTQNQWRVDLQEGLRGGGAAYSSFETAIANEDISLRYTVLASGMRDIAMLHPNKYQMLLRAHTQSRNYLETCLENLNSSSPQAPLPPETLTVLQTAFDHPPSDQTVGLLREYAQRILHELLSASMDTATSKRIVVGMNMPDQRDTYAFTYREDPGKRIFFTERFFTLPWDVSVYATPPAVDLLAHQQAATLIHELSHQVLRTVDIAYVEAAAPFPDQINRHTRGGRIAYQTILGYKRDGFSINTSPQALFRTFDTSTQTWRDIKNKDGSALPAIYRLSKTNTLAAARTAFYNDPHVRTDLILANADSLALIISKLGRRRFAAAG